MGDSGRDRRTILLFKVVVFLAGFIEERCQLQVDSWSRIRILVVVFLYFNQPRVKFREVLRPLRGRQEGYVGLPGVFVGIEAVEGGCSVRDAVEDLGGAVLVLEAAVVGGGGPGEEVVEGALEELELLVGLALELEDRVHGGG